MFCYNGGHRIEGEGQLAATARLGGEAFSLCRACAGVPATALHFFRMAHLPLARLDPPDWRPPAGGPQTATR